jgi:protein-tyrosine phosphatase
MLPKIRSAVSQDRHRYKDGKYDLDLSYITDRLIAMAIPASGIATAWRNTATQVSKMLNERHPDKFMIWNLSELTYTYSKFNNQILEFPFPDHHNPPLELVFQIMLSMGSWLDSCDEHVAVVHCKGGKGRTGTVVACYLLYCGLFDDAEQALGYFAAKRSAKKLGVTQPSQRRYVQYFAEVLRKRLLPLPKPMTVVRVLLTSVPMAKQPNSKAKSAAIGAATLGLSGGGGAPDDDDARQLPTIVRPMLIVYDNQRSPKTLLYRTAVGDLREYTADDAAVVWELGRGLRVWGDVLVACYHASKRGRKKALLFRVSFHTAFIDDSGILALPADELDELSDACTRAERRPDGVAGTPFSLQVIFEEAKSARSTLPITGPAHFDVYRRCFAGTRMREVAETVRTRKLSTLVTFARGTVNLGTGNDVTSLMQAERDKYESEMAASSSSSSSAASSSAAQLPFSYGVGADSDALFSSVSMPNMAKQAASARNGVPAAPPRRKRIARPLEMPPLPQTPAPRPTSVALAADKQREPQPAYHPIVSPRSHRLRQPPVAPQRAHLNGSHLVRDRSVSVAAGGGNDGSCSHVRDRSVSVARAGSAARRGGARGGGIRRGGTRGREGVSGRPPAVAPRPAHTRRTHRRSRSMDAASVQQMSMAADLAERLDRRRRLNNEQQ